MGEALCLIASRTDQVEGNFLEAERRVIWVEVPCVELFQVTLGFPQVPK